MIDPITTVSLTVLTGVSVCASVLALLGLRPGNLRIKLRPIEQVLLAACAAGGAALELYRMLVVHDGWRLLRGHIDGVLVVATLLAMALFEMHRRARMNGLAAFAVPIHTLMMAWAIFAASWNGHTFRIDSVVMAAHHVGIYLGAFCAVAAASGGMLFLFARHRLRSKQQLPDQAPLASLEAIERFVRRLATVGFAMLTAGVLLGIFVASTGPSRMGPMWWQTPKFALGMAAWLVYAAIVTGQYVSRFRMYTAWLSIVGLVLILATFGIVMTNDARLDKPVDDIHRANQVDSDLPADTRRSP